MRKGIKWTLTVVAAIAVAALLRCCVATSYLIPSSGMENSLYKGERILVNKWSYGLRLPFMSLWGYHRWADSPVSKEDIIVFNNPANLKEPQIDRREVFIGRCIGTPGDTLLTDDGDNPHVKAEAQLTRLLQSLGIPAGSLLGQDSLNNVRSFSRYEYYLLQQEISGDCWVKPLMPTDSTSVLQQLVVPGKGITVEVTPRNITLLRNTLVMHEHVDARIKNDTLYINGRPTRQCRFSKDYYWVVANNSMNLSDSRLFGFVPKDHIIGRASRIWFSKEEGSSLFSRYRWDRIWTKVR